MQCKHELILGSAMLLLICTQAKADIAGTLEDYMFCADESALTKERNCIKCLGTNEANYNNTSSIESCKAESYYKSSDFEKICQSETMFSVWAEVWCKKLQNNENTTDTEDTDVISEAQKDDKSARCSVFAVSADNDLNRSLITLLTVLF